VRPATGEPSFRDLTGVAVDGFPLLAERLAIDATSALRAGELGLRGLRGRSLLRRLWEGASGRVDARSFALTEDVLTVQRATVAIVREVVREGERTQYCMHRVLVNLHGLNRDLDEVAARQTGLEHTLRAETARLARQLHDVQRQLDREAGVRRLTERYRAGDLYQGADETLRAALWLAAVRQTCWGAEPSRQRDELGVALAVVRQRLSPRPIPLEEALLGTVEGSAASLSEVLRYLGQDRGPHLAVVTALAERRLARLPSSEASAAEAIAIARATRDPDGALESRIVRPVELAEALAAELSSDLLEEAPR
jgi:hypothetical protein